MKVLLDINDDKAVHLLAVLKSLRFVKTTQITEEKAEILYEVREALENLKLVREGMMKSQSAEVISN